MPKYSIYRTIGMILLGFGLFHLIASAVAVVFWLLVGDWRDLVPQIVVIAFWLTLPTAYLVRKKYFGEKS